MGVWGVGAPPPCWAGARAALRAGAALPPLATALESAALTLEVERLLEEDGTLAMAGLDPASELLAPGRPPSLDPEDLLAQLTLARTVATVRRRLLAAPAELTRVREMAASLPDTEPLLRRVAPLLGRDGRVPDEATPELARLRAVQSRTRQLLLGELEALRRAHPDVVNDAPPTVRRDRYCLAVKASGRSSLPGLVLDVSASGLTAFLEPFAVVELNNTLVAAAAGEREEMRRILAEVAAVFAAVADDLIAAAEVLARLDAAQARALFGRRSQGRVVVPGDGHQLVVRAARHPLLDPLLAPLRAEVFAGAERRSSDASVVPLDLVLADDLCALVVSGPNAGGKTVVLKTVGLVVLMAYHGIPVAVADGTTVPAFDSLWCHIGDEQDVAADLSTFSGAMAATARLLATRGARVLVLYDELGAGTDPLEGAALGCALLEEITRRRWLAIATTHLAGIAMNATGRAGMDNAAMEYDEERGRPTYQLRLGRPGRSRALEIAAAVGLAAPVVERARELLGGDHLQLDRWLRRLERLEGELLAERTTIGRERAALEHRSADLEAARSRLAGEAAAVRAGGGVARGALRRLAEQRLDEALAEIAAATREQRHLGRRRQEAVRQHALDLPAVAATGGGDAVVAPGMMVRLAGLGSEGEVQELRGDQVLVAVKGKRLWLALAQVETVAATAPAPRRAGLGVSVDESAPAELLLIGLDAEAAREEVEHFLDRAVAVGRTVVRIVHGHGTGTLRRAVAEVCRAHPGVHSFCHPPQSRGGSGATEVTLDPGDGSRA